MSEPITRAQKAILNNRMVLLRSYNRSHYPPQSFLDWREEQGLSELEKKINELSKSEACKLISLLILEKWDHVIATWRGFTREKNEEADIN